jgi:hypothetical protein
MRSGTTSSTARVSNTPSLTLMFWIGLARSNATPNRCASVSESPGIREPPPEV